MMRNLPEVLQQGDAKAAPRKAAERSTLTPTPTADTLPRRYADFGTLGEALDYAASGVRGLNFHDPRGQLARAYTFRELRPGRREAADIEERQPLERLRVEGRAGLFVWSSFHCAFFVPQSGRIKNAPYAH